ncbi:helicase associated domain-containing protein [Streptomyces sp. NPDC047461]
MATARQFHAAEGHLRVPRQHREAVDGKLLGLWGVHHQRPHPRLTVAAAP